MAMTPARRARVNAESLRNCMLIVLVLVLMIDSSMRCFESKILIERQVL